MSDRHRLELAGYNALLADHCELVDRVAALMARVAALEDRISAPANSAQETVVDLGHGWQIVRLPADEH